MFVPLSFEKQVEEASLGVEVQLNDLKVYKNASGMIMTEYSFDVLESYNLREDDLENQKLKLSMPGGTYEGITSMIDSAPQFIKGERSFLLLKKIDSKIYLSNFTLGKYKIEEHEGKTFYVSEIFPLDSKIGKITKEKMIELMKNKWKFTTKLPENVSAEKTALTPALGLKPFLKSVASLERSPAESSNDNSEIPLGFWWAIGLFIFCFGFIFIKIGRSENLHKSE